ncbi:hypothetical protein SDC9_89221 [bioreactor metagenome]|uniref:Uncharacterized protein n=1 Tax=bioreactor metagenome TaxID=1076179 RepID=A0A644ZNS3_9ZZZZ
MVDELKKLGQRDNKQSTNIIKKNRMLSKGDWLIVVSALVLFIVNNIFLSIFLSKMPGGSAAGITTIYVISLVSLVLRKFKSITMIFIIYGSIGILSHIMVEDWIYIPKAAIVIMIAAAFDFILYKNNYRATSFIFGFAIFIFLLNITEYSFSYLFEDFAKPMNIKNILLSLAHGYIGIIFAFATYELIKNKRIITEIEK